jgi:hypothetical protein
VWACVMLWGCLRESSGAAVAWPVWLAWLGAVPHLDKWAHMGMHAVLAGLLWWAVYGWAQQRRQGCMADEGVADGRLARWNPWWGVAIVLVCASFGGLIEGLQWGLTDTRSAEWLDALANTVGASVSVLGLTLLSPLWMRWRVRKLSK